VKPAAIVFSERLDNESFCAAIVRELAATHDVRPCGPGWPTPRLEDVDPTGARFFLELDAVTGNFVRPSGLQCLHLPKFAWLVDTHKKLDFHRLLAREVDLVFHAHQAWGHVFEGPHSWLPLHADGEVFRPVDVDDASREWDVAFVGSQTWRADPVRRLAERHGLRALVTTTTGPREKSETAAIYARARVVFNQHVANDLNFRVFEAAACGRVLLTDAQANGQYELFEDDRHYALFKDERDLERQLLRLLGDAPLRARIERETAAHATAKHTTRARVAQLVAGIDAFLGARAEPASPARPSRGPFTFVSTVRTATAPPSPAAPVEPAPRATPARRVLLLAGDEAPTVSLQSYGEALATTLAARGHEVVVVRQRRGALPPRPARPGAPTVLELAAGPLPDALTDENRILLAAGPAHVQVDRFAREHGPVDVVLAEGPLAHHTGPALCGRLGLPLVVLLAEHEVVRRQNQLNRSQVYRAQLEHWACDRARLVVAASAAVADAARQHYEVREPLVVPWPASAAAAPAPTPADRARFAQRLGLRLDEPFVLVLARDLGPDLRRELRAHGRVVVAAEDGLSLADGSAVGRRAVRGPALAALLGLAAVVLVDDPHDPRRPDAERLAARLAVGSVRGPADLRRQVDAARPPTPASMDVSVLERGLEQVLGRTPEPAQRREEVALVLR
jgi:hypothetical protein